MDAVSGEVTRCRRNDSPHHADKGQKLEHSSSYRTQVLPSRLRGTGSGRQPRPVRVDWITDDRRDHAAVTQKPFDARGLYDGQGGFVEPDATIEAHLAKIESAAAVTIRKFTAKKIGEGGFIPPEIARFLAWQAARTPGWMELVQQRANEPWFDLEHEAVEPPPIGFEKITGRMRPMCLEDLNTGARHEVTVEEEFYAYLKRGWRWIMRRDDQLEMLHIQAWYFQVRHFPRLSWVRLQPPDYEFFITSDRSVAWLADGYADTPPAALRHPTAQVVAPLTRETRARWTTWRPCTERDTSRDQSFRSLCGL